MNKRIRQSGSASLILALLLLGPAVLQAESPSAPSARGHGGIDPFISQDWYGQVVQDIQCSQHAQPAVQHARFSLLDLLNHASRHSGLLGEVFLGHVQVQPVPANPSAQLFDCGYVTQT